MHSPDATLKLKRYDDCAVDLMMLGLELTSAPYEKTISLQMLLQSRHSFSCLLPFFQFVTFEYSFRFLQAHM